jgi:gluconolactonase
MSMRSTPQSLRPAVVAAFLAVTASAATGIHPYPPGQVERLDPALDRLLAPGTALEQLADGFSWAEGPVWLDGAVLFSDVPRNTVYQWKPGSYGAGVFLHPSGSFSQDPGVSTEGSNGLAHDAQGRLLLCQHGARRIARYESGQFVSVAERYEGKRFNSPNDLAVRPNGDIYFTDPPYGLLGGDKSPQKEQPGHGIYRVSPDGKVTLLSDAIRFCNGIGFSPDGKVVYIGSTDPAAPKLYAFDVQADGTFAHLRVFFDPAALIKAGDKGGCDGLKVDREGNVWASGPGGLLIVSPSGRLLGRIKTHTGTANCAWGDDGGTLYITAQQYLLRIRTLTKGDGW